MTELSEQMILAVVSVFVAVPTIPTEAHPLVGMATAVVAVATVVLTMDPVLRPCDESWQPTNQVKDGMVEMSHSDPALSWKAGRRRLLLLPPTFENVPTVAGHPFFVGTADWRPVSFAEVPVDEPLVFVSCPVSSLFWVPRPTLPPLPSLVSELVQLALVLPPALVSVPGWTAQV